MPSTLANLGQIYLDEWTQNSRGMKFAPAKLSTREPVSFYLGAPGTYPATLPWEPSTYQGDGTEERKTIVFNLSDHLWQNVQELEQRLIAAIGGCDAWCSACKESKTGVRFIRAKINTGGPRKAAVFDEKGEPRELPDPWRRVDANAIIICRGVYQQGRSKGPLLEVVSLQLQQRPDFNPWLLEPDELPECED
jgi:hypothetical protein